MPREQIPAAVTLNAISNNIARAVGPALGGLMVAAFVHRARTGAAWVFFLNSASYAGVIWILLAMEAHAAVRARTARGAHGDPVRSGLRYLRYSPPLQAPLLRALIFTFFVSAVWSLLAVVARQDLQQGALGYGILNGSLGVGAIIGATTLARIRQRMSVNTLLAFNSMYYIVGLLILAFVKIPWIVILSLVVGGFCWTSTMSSINVAVQLSVPAWVQARALGAYLMTFQGGLALGSVVWGEIAERSSTKVSLICAAAGMLLTLPIVLRTHILQGDGPDHSPYRWKRPIPDLAMPPDPEDGPVRISVDYFIPAENYAAFTHVVHELEGVRSGGGAIGLLGRRLRDAANPWST